MTGEKNGNGYVKLTTLLVIIGLFLGAFYWVMSGVLGRIERVEATANLSVERTASMGSSIEGIESDVLEIKNDIKDILKRVK